MIDLTKLQNQYRVTHEESYKHAGVLDKSAPDFILMYQIIAGKYGEIYPHDDTTLAAYVLGNKRAKRVSRLEGVTAYIDRDGETVFLFKPDNITLLYHISRVIKARKKRKASDTERERLKHIGFQRQAEGLANSPDFYTINEGNEG